MFPITQILIHPINTYKFYYIFSNLNINLSHTTLSNTFSKSAYEPSILCYTYQIKIKSIYLHSNTMQEQTSIKMQCKSSPPNKTRQIKHFQFTSKLFNSAVT